MALRLIRTDGDEILRKTSKPVEQINQSIITLLDDMKETLKENNGVGLAAPQVGILKRIIVIDIGDGPIEIINPQISDEEGFQVGVEGCLSIPEVFGEVKRPLKLKVKGINREGKNIEIEAEDLLAIVVCHEVDHLDGILFKDKVIKFIELEGKKKR
ncbi:MAG: peptide deformylase [Deltaproteobacteria bacterium]